MDWNRVLRTIDILTAALAALAALGCGLFWGLDASSSVLAGAFLMWLDVRVIARLVAGARVGTIGPRLLVLLLLPAKFVGLIVLMYVSIVVLELDPLAFVLGVSAVVVAILVAGTAGRWVAANGGGEND